MWTLATKTNILGSDPILWFCLMFMPTGPPAARLSALADVGGAEEHQKLSIAKFLTVMNHTTLHVQSSFHLSLFSVLFLVKFS
jgi:hypothetical protein